jgi:hypothetical protein
MRSCDDVLGRKPTLGAGWYLNAAVIDTEPAVAVICFLQRNQSRPTSGGDVTQATTCIHVAANGFAVLETHSPAAYVWWTAVLIVRHGFIPWGRLSASLPDQSIYPTFRRRRLRLLAGWDVCGGFHLMADSSAADAFLRAFAAQRGAKAATASS